jgi:hypothetical protein
VHVTIPTVCDGGALPKVFFSYFFCVHITNHSAVAVFLHRHILMYKPLDVIILRTVLTPDVCDGTNSKLLLKDK